MDGKEESELEQYKRFEANQKYIDDINSRAERERIDNKHAEIVGLLALVIVILLGVLFQ